MTLSCSPRGPTNWRLALTRFSRLHRNQPQWGRRTRGPGRVSCKNIKPECPALACVQPRLLPGHCCQTCPPGKSCSAVRGGRHGSDTWSRATRLGRMEQMERPTGPPSAQLKPGFSPPGLERSGPERPPTGLAFEYPRDPEHRSYSDRGEPGAEDRVRGDGHTGRYGPGRSWGGGGGRAAAAGDNTPGHLFLADFVALLTGPRSQAVARARVSLLRSSLRFSISYRQ